MDISTPSITEVIPYASNHNVPFNMHRHRFSFELGLNNINLTWCEILTSGLVPDWVATVMERLCLRVRMIRWFPVRMTGFPLCTPNDETWLCVSVE